MRGDCMLPFIDGTKLPLSKKDAQIITDLWSKIVTSLRENPRDFETTPLNNRECKYFYAFVKDDDNHHVYVERPEDINKPSDITDRRTLDSTYFSRVYPLYLRRQIGEHVSAEASKTTVNASYYYALIRHILDTDLKI